MKSRLLLAVIAIAFLAGANDKKEDAIAKDLKNLEGAWTVVTVTLDGKSESTPEKSDKEECGEITITADKISWNYQADNRAFSFTFSYKIDPSKKPKVMILDEEVKNALPGKAIYDLDGDKLRICVGPPDKLPDEFSDKGHMLFTLKRKKARE